MLLESSGDLLLEDEVATVRKKARFRSSANLDDRDIIHTAYMYVYLSRQYHPGHGNLQKKFVRYFKGT